MNTPDQPSTPKPAALARFGQGPWKLIVRNLILGLGFVVIVAGSLANIALFLDSRGAGSELVTAAPSGEAAELAANVEIEATATPTASTAQVDPGSTSVSPSLSPPDVISTTYTVVSGDVLYEIAVRHGTTPNALIELNNLVDPNRIEVGQVLLLPSREPEVAPNS